MGFGKSYCKFDGSPLDMDDIKFLGDTFLPRKFGMNFHYERKPDGSTGSVENNPFTIITDEPISPQKHRRLIAYGFNPCPENPLHQINEDGSLKTDSRGLPIPVQAD
ncbi:hypothetical protein CL614_04865 [archaeon]|nr:hypothetical protein [archaeon]|tara:strand:- start:5347 stop:5667 length:321 start_codon:yes stop_codon:yes gene_type:complete